jgi:DnaJ like chaperone protein
MAWKGKFFGAVIGFLVTRNVWGAILGAIIGHMFDDSAGRWFATGAYDRAAAGGALGGAPRASVSETFFRTTFELMGHVAKSDGRVSEAEIEAARRLMQELQLGPAEIHIAIDRFRFGKSAGYDVASSVEVLRATCAMRHDLKRAFVELQLRAALAGNGFSLPARTILTRVAERLGISALEFVHMEAAARARQHARSGPGGRPSSEKPLADSYAELEIDAAISDQEVTKAYRRQMSRHHPDKLVANGYPESMTRVAKEKTQRIQEAYEAIRAARGMR